MILADKIVNLRKKNGWSQEQLAERLNVTRQSVSKWEGGQSIPDIDKIIQMSNVFGVTTDYLIKDEIQSEEHLETIEDVEEIHKISLESALNYLETRKRVIGPFAFAVFLLIISPIMLIMLSGFSEYGIINVSVNVAVAIGLICLVIFVAVGVGILIKSSVKLNDYEFLAKENFETEYGVTGIVKEKKQEYQDKYTVNLIIGITLCILSTVPLFAAIGYKDDNSLLNIVSVCALLFIAGLGVNFIIRAVMRNDSFDQLLEEGEYAKENKYSENSTDVIGAVFWPLVVATYLAYSFITNDWGRSWIIWPVAALIFASLSAIINYIRNKKK